MVEPETRRPAILDTDVGTDVDDILALVLLARAVELQFVGVTTVYGDTTLRARMTRLVLDQMDRSDVPIGVGARETLTGRPVMVASIDGPARIAANVAFGPRCTIGSLIESFASTSAVISFSQVGCPFAAPAETSTRAGAFAGTVTSCSSFPRPEVPPMLKP